MENVTIKKLASYEEDPCNYEYLELENGLKIVLISEKRVGTEPATKYRDDEIHKSVDSKETSNEISISKSDAKKEDNSEKVDQTSIERSTDEGNADSENSASKPSLPESPPGKDYQSSTPNYPIHTNKKPMGKVCITFECGSMHDEAYLPGIGDICRQITQFYSFDPGVVPTSKTDVGQTTFYHILYDVVLDSYLETVAKIMTKPPENKNILQRFIKHPIRCVDWYFENTFDEGDMKLISEKEVCMIYMWYKHLQHISPNTKSGLEQIKNLKSDEEIFKLVEQYWNRFYVPQNASIVIKSEESLEFLEKLVVQYFSPLKNRNEKTSCVINPNFSAISASDQKWIEIKDDEKDEGERVNLDCGHTLLISWILPPEYWRAYLAKPHLYISWIMNNQGKKSLAAILGRKNWATSICAGCNHTSYHRNELCTVFQIRIRLTDKGLQEKDEVLKCIFSAIQNVAVNKDIFEQVNLTSSLSLRKLDFSSLPYECSSSMFLIDVVNISSAIRKFPPENILNGEVILGEFDLCAEIIEKFKKLLVPQTAHFILQSSSAREGNSIEKYFQTKFFQETIDEAKLNEWSSPSQHLDVHQWKVSVINSYIEKRPVFVVPSNPRSYNFPRLLRKNNFYEIWHKQDIKTKEMVVIGMHFVSPVVRKRPINEIFCEVMAKFLNELLTSELFEAKLANYRWKCEKTFNGIMITVMGPRFKITSVIKTTMDTYIELQKSINQSPEICHRIHSAIQSALKQKVNDGKEIVDDIVHSLFNKNYNTLQDRYTAALVPLNIRKFRSFVTSFKDKIHGYFFSQGNLTEDEAKGFFLEHVSKKIFPLKNPAKLINILAKPVKWVVSPTTNIIRVDTVNSWTKEPICQMHCHCGLATMTNIARAKINLALLEDELRNPKVYIPDGFRFEPELRIIHDSLNFYFTFFYSNIKVAPQQALKTSRSQLIETIDDFFYNWYHRFIKTLTPNKIDDCISRYEQEHNITMELLTVHGEVSYFLDQVKSLDFAFDIEAEVEEYADLSYNSIQRWAKNNFLRDTGDTSRMIFIVLENSSRPLPFEYSATNPHDLIVFPIEEIETPHLKYVTDFQTFKKTGNTAEQNDSAKKS